MSKAGTEQTALQKIGTRVFDPICHDLTGAFRVCVRGGMADDYTFLIYKFTFLKSGRKKIAESVHKQDQINQNEGMFCLL